MEGKFGSEVAAGSGGSVTCGAVGMVGRDGIGTLGIGKLGSGTLGSGTLGSGKSGRGTAGSGTGKLGNGGSGSGSGRVGSGGKSTLETWCTFADFGRIRASATLVSLIMDENVRSRSGKMNVKLLEPIVGANK
uniref:Uncharacterized protein n=1 Tax=Cajanus cajan TaxID=3821 RepID=A0A151T7P4_CAJCA|nr:hypothetical protein KK1_017620 [Cajanus cajan]